MVKRWLQLGFLRFLFRLYQGWILTQEDFIDVTGYDNEVLVDLGNGFGMFLWLFGGKELLRYRGWGKILGENLAHWWRLW